MNSTNAQTAPTGDAVVRARIMAAIESGLTLGELARGSGVNRAIVSQYCAAGGNTYPGDVAKYEALMDAFLDRRGLEILSGIPTIETPVSTQIFSAARMAQRTHLMVKCIGPAGIGKTRGAAVVKQKDETAVVLAVSQARGTLESVRAEVFRLFGIRGPQKGRNGAAEKYALLIKKLRGTELLLVIDQAHRLGSAAIHFLCELWNDTQAPQLWLGTEALVSKLARDAQWATRLHATFPLAVAPEEIHELVKHQVKSRLNDLNGEGVRITNPCEKLATRGSFRSVENHLALMAYLHTTPENKNRSWVELFEDAGFYLEATATLED